MVRATALRPALRLLAARRGERRLGVVASQCAAVRAPFNYCAGEASKVLITNPFEGDGFDRCKQAGAIANVEHPVFDGREDADLVDPSGISLARRGFTLQQHTSAVSDWESAEDVQDKYYPEICRMAERLTGASRTHVASHVLRRAGPEKANPGEGAVRGGAYFVHQDFCDVLLDQFAGMAADGKPSVLSEPPLALSASQMTSGRLVVLNFWRSIGEGPVRRAPLAVLDAASTRPAELHQYAHEPKSVPPHYQLPMPIMLTLPESRPEHRWYYFSEMHKDEVIVLKAHDSIGKMPENGVSVHSAFDLPDMLPDAPVRKSLEARVICWFDE